MVGASVGWTSALVQGRILYQREVDPRVDQFVSERGGAEIVLRTPIRLDLTAGADYDIAQGFLGSAEARLDYALPRGWGALSGGVRQCRPHFPLWTIWGAFSPVPYQAVFGSVTVVPLRGIELLARGEGYRYSDVEAVTPLVETEDRGWRYSFRGTYARSAPWSVYYAFHSEFGAGAYFTCGHPFPDETKAICDEADAILKGPIGLSHEESKKIPVDDGVSF